MAANHVMVVSAGEPNGVTSRSIVSPATTGTRDESLQLVATPAIEQVRTVAEPFLSTVSVQLAPPPGAVETNTWRSVMFEKPGGTANSRGPSVAETAKEPSATYESVELSVSAAPPAMAMRRSGGEGPHGIGPWGVLTAQP